MREDEENPPSLLGSGTRKVTVLKGRFRRYQRGIGVWGCQPEEACWRKPLCPGPQGHHYHGPVVFWVPGSVKGCGEQKGVLHDSLEAAGSTWAVCTGAQAGGQPRGRWEAEEPQRERSVGKVGQICGQGCRQNREPGGEGWVDTGGESLSGGPRSAPGLGAGEEPFRMMWQGLGSLAAVERKGAS